MLKKQKKLSIPHTNISLISSDFRTQNSFFLNPTNKSGIQNMISSLDSNKSVRPNSIPIKILNLLKNDIFSQLADIFNISLSPGVFPTILKLANVARVYKRLQIELFKILANFPIIQY